MYKKFLNFDLSNMMDKKYFKIMDNGNDPPACPHSIFGNF